MRNLINQIHLKKYEMSPEVQEIKIPVFKAEKLEHFFRPYIEKVLGHEGEDTEYLTTLLARLRGEDVSLLKKEAYFSDMQWANLNLSPDFRAEYFRGIGDSVMGVYGFFPEITQYRHEFRDEGFFVQVGSKAYHYAARDSKEQTYAQFLNLLSRQFDFYLAAVRSVRGKVDGDKYLQNVVEQEKIRAETHSQLGKKPIKQSQGSYNSHSSLLGRRHLSFQSTCRQKCHLSCEHNP